jgi:hypothetical protein
LFEPKTCPIDDPIHERRLMTDPSPTFKGVIHGKFIELDRELGLPDGQEVTVTVEPVPAQSPPCPLMFLSEEVRRRWEEAWAQVKDLPPGEGLRRAAGAWAEDAEELDEYLEWSCRQRKIGRRELEP